MIETFFSTLHHCVFQIIVITLLIIFAFHYGKKINPSYRSYNPSLSPSLIIRLIESTTTPVNHESFRHLKRDPSFPPLFVSSSSSSPFVLPPFLSLSLSLVVFAERERAASTLASSDLELIRVDREWIKWKRDPLDPLVLWSSKHSNISIVGIFDLGWISIRFERFSDRRQSMINTSWKQMKFRGDLRFTLNIVFELIFWGWRLKEYWVL